MAALQAREMSKKGFEVLQIDLFGCGDSSGNFSDANWRDWETDVQLACQWLRSRTDAPLTFWGLRAGCLLAVTAAANNLEEHANFIFWQPVVHGKQHWQQFLRLKIASELSSGKGKGVADRFRQKLSMGEAVEIAGYTLSPALVEGLEAAELKFPDNTRGRVAWLEMSMREGATLSPSSRKCVAQMEDVVCGKLDARIIHGPAFWQSVEIEDAPELIEATTALLGYWE